MPDPALRSYFAALPKIDLHRHLEGSIRLSTLLEVGKQYHLDLPASTLDELRPHVQITAADTNDAAHFLKKFSVLRRFFCAPDVIRRVAREAVIDAALDHIHYLELRFTPRALAGLMDFNYYEVISWVIEGIQQAQREHSITVGLIIAVNRHEGIRDAERQLQAAIQHRQHGVVGFDLCGREFGYPADSFFELFRQAGQEGLGITVHAGEWAGPRNVRDAIERIGSRRIGHGVRIIEDNSVTKLALETGTTFEVCLTSNVQSGVVYALEHHPIQDMKYLGLRTTLNTDDPSISAITLSEELALAVERLKLTIGEVQQMQLRSVEAAFLPADKRAHLTAALQKAYATVEITNGSQT
jgi:adenosine deaminase